MTEYSPQQLSIKRRQLAQEYNEKMKELGELKKRKALEIIRIMGQPDTKSQKHAELIYSATEDGQKELEITFYCKGLIELMRSIKTEIEIRQSEAYNIY